MNRLENKVAVIVGAGSGMGRASAILFAEEGAKVVVGDYNDVTGQQVVEEIKAAGNEASYCHVDATKGEDVKGIMDFAIATYGKIDVVFCTAGKPQTVKMIWELDDEEFDKQVAINSKSAWLCAKYSALELKKNHGSLILIGSTGAIRCRATQGTYGACKAFNNTFTIGMACELAPEARCNLINPGPTDTPMFSGFIVGEYNDQVKAGVAGGTLLQRFVDPRDIANMALFFASDESAAVTGVSVLVDCGADKSRGKN